MASGIRVPVLPSISFSASPPAWSSGVPRLRSSATSMRGSPCHRLHLYVCLLALSLSLLVHFQGRNLTVSGFLRKCSPASHTWFMGFPQSAPCWSSHPRYSNKLCYLLPFLFQCQGGAGASSPRNINSQSSGPPAETAVMAASPVNPEKKQRKSSSLCKGRPAQTSPGRAPGLPAERNRATPLLPRHSSLGA